LSHERNSLQLDLPHAPPRTGMEAHASVCVRGVDEELIVH
jgi:hypothetical protein